jgi:hypothetical protein
VHPDLLENVFDVLANGAAGDEEPVPDDLVRQPFAGQTEDLPFPVGQLRHTGSPPLCVEVDLVQMRAQQLQHHDVPVAEIVGRTVLEEDAARPSGWRRQPDGEAAAYGLEVAPIRLGAAQLTVAVEVGPAHGMRVRGRWELLAAGQEVAAVGEVFDGFLASARWGDTALVPSHEVLLSDQRLMGPVQLAELDAVAGDQLSEAFEQSPRDDIARVITTGIVDDVQNGPQVGVRDGQGGIQRRAPPFRCPR